MEATFLLSDQLPRFMKLVNAGNFLQLAALAITQLKEAITR